jgi:hypothetical protein
LSAGITSDAAELYNVMVASFTPASLKGIVFLAGPAMVAADQGAHFGEQLAALANCWKRAFGCEDPRFVFTLPSKALAPKVTPPTGITGKSTAVEIEQWLQTDRLLEAVSGE